MHLSLLVESFVTTKVIRVRYKDKPCNDDCRLALDQFVHYHRRANAVYAEAMRQFSVRSRDVLMNAQCPHKWWSNLKSAVFGSGSDSSLPPLIGAGGILVCESVGKADAVGPF